MSTKMGEYQRSKVHRTLAIVRDIKDRPCHDCAGEFPWYVMTFDHVPQRGPKTLTFGHIQRRPPSRERLREELLRCDVVCANCQAIRTFRRMQGEEVGDLDPTISIPF